MIQKYDWVLYNSKEYEVIHIYDGSGYCELRGIERELGQKLVRPDEITKIEKRKIKTPEQ